MIREALAAAVLSTAMPAVAEAQASAPQPITIGIVDVAGTKVIGGDKRTKIEYRQFNPEGSRPGRWNTKAGVDHGEVVVTSFVRQVRSMDKNVPIRILSANATYMHPSNPNVLKFHTEGAKKALEWFAQNGVKIVVTTMTSKDTPAMQAFRAEAQKHGMIVFASAGNDVVRGVPSYPAAYPESISIVGDNPTLALRKDPSVANWVKFAMNGEIELEGFLENSVKDEGSSMAVARAGAIGAYAVATGKALPERESVEAALRSVSQQKAYTMVASSVTVTVSYIEMVGAGQKLAGLSPAAIKSAAKEESAGVATMAAYAAKGGNSR
jgi:hypothetical protein